jgi:hypothetical protein
VPARRLAIAGSCAILGVRAESSLPKGKRPTDARSRQLQPRDRLVVAGQQSELHVLLLSEPIQQLAHPGKHSTREIVGEQSNA